MQSYLTHSQEETAALAAEFAAVLKRGDVVALYGELGSGKTRFVQGICKGLGIREHVASPTFTIVNEYTVRDLKIFHFDFYRVKSLKEIIDIGFEEYAFGSGICLIEWAEKAREILPAQRYDVHLTLGKTGSEREITVEHLVEITA